VEALKEHRFEVWINKKLDQLVCLAENKRLKVLLVDLLPEKNAAD
jgi:uncharacterized HAD superfamily protein